jgi:NTE family protein
MITNLVLAGAGARGLVYIPCIRILEKYNLLKNLKIIIGTSIGSLIGTLYTIGYSGVALEKIFLNYNPSDTISINEDHIMHYFTKCGIENGNGLKKAITIFFKHKNLNKDITFKELYDINNIKLVIVGTNLSTSLVEYFNYEDTPDMSIITAMLISSCIPCYYMPIEYNNNKYTDGGLINNFAFNYINENELNNTIGLYTDRNNSKINIDKGIINYFIAIYETMRQIFIPKNKGYFIKFNPSIKGMDFDISNEQKIACFEYGANITLQFIANNILLLEL